MKWSELTEQEKMVWAATYALEHRYNVDKDEKGPIVCLSDRYRLSRKANERCESVANDCVRDLRALNATDERYC